MAATLNYDDLTQLEDLNGSAFVIANVGEVEEDFIDLYTLLPPANMEPAAMTWPLNECLATATNAVKAEIQRYIGQVYWLNFIQLYYNTDKFRGQAQAASATAYLRMLLVREGLANPTIDPATRHCQYNLCRRADGFEEQLFGQPDWFNGVHTATVADAGNDYSLDDFREHYTGGKGTGAGGVRPIVYRNKPILTAAEKDLLREQFTDIICLVAFLFRTRAHHWTPDMDATYRRLWKGCVKSMGREAPLCDWEACGRYVCKTPFPLQLDEFWFRSINESKCSAKLAIRWDSPAAGTAGLVALRRGYDDLRSAFPVLDEKLGNSVRALLEQEEKIKDDRWGPSINSKFYGVANNRVNEKGLAPLAATIMAALQQFNETAPLSKSKALERLASSAPIIGAVVSNILGRVAAHESVVYSYIPTDIRSLMTR